jgi:hypothetical protein
MSLKRRIDRLEQVSPAFYSDASEIPTPLLEAMLRQAYRVGEWPATPEDAILHRRLEECGRQYQGEPKRTGGIQRNGLNYS